MASRKHVVITGTGRCGTTFLVELLTHIGLETGYSVDNLESRKNKNARAGLERDIRAKDCPFIVKSPLFCHYAEDIISRDDIVIEHVFVPIRDLSAAAESRRHVVKTGLLNLSFIEHLKNMIKPKKFDGGLWRTSLSKQGNQEEVLLGQIYELMLAISGTTIPVTFMHFPKIVKDCPYLYEKLKPILQGITYESFCAAFNKTVRPELVHSFNKKDC